MNVKAVIVDDEITSIETLKIELQRHCPFVTILSTFQDPREALTQLPTLTFDILFLDIEMPWLNGFEMLRKLENLPFKVIFITAYDQYAIQAFKVSAVDYLLKPIQSAELVEAVDKIRSNMLNAFHNLKIQNLLTNLSKSNLNDQKLLLSTNDGLEFIPIQDIIHCLADSNYTRIFTTNGEIYLAKTLKEIEEMLDGYNFFRIHSSHLISIAHIKKYVKNDGIVFLTNGYTASVSRLRKESFIQFIHNYHIV